jgi:hypothetical protein
MSVTPFLKAAGGMLASAAMAAQAATTITLQPDESSSKDVFLYEFDVPGVFGIPTPPRATNLDSATLNTISPPPVPFGNFLGAAKTDPFALTPGGPLREHGTRTLIGFDLGMLSLAPAMVASATLNLYALPALRAFESPNEMNPVTTDLRRVTQAWGETTATWDTAPSVDSMSFATVVQNGVNQWVRFDVTGLVRDWLQQPASNFGVELSQREVVEMEVPGQRDRYFASLYASSASDDAALRPYLSISAVPEPSTWALWACGAAVVAWIGRRRRGAAAAA